MYLGEVESEVSDPSWFTLVDRELPESNLKEEWPPLGAPFRGKPGGG